MTNGRELYYHSQSTQSTPSISKDGNFIAVGSNRNVIIMETTNWTEVTFLVQPTGSDNEIVCAWSYDNSKLAMSNGRGSVIIYETSGWTAWSNLVDLSNSAIFSLNFSVDDTLLAVSIDDNSLGLNVINVDQILVSGSAFTSSLLGSKSYDNGFTDTDLIALARSTDPNTVIAWDVISFNVVTLADAISINQQAMSINPNNNYIAIGGNISPYLTILNVSDLTPIADTPPVLSGSCRGIAWNHP